MVLKLELCMYAVPMECSKLQIDVTFGVGLAQARSNNQFVEVLLVKVLCVPYLSKFLPIKLLHYMGTKV